MYETMVYWSRGTVPISRLCQGLRGDLAGGRKVVYSSTLETVSSASTRIEREFDLRLSGGSRNSRRDITVGGAELAGRRLPLACR